MSSPGSLHPHELELAALMRQAQAGDQAAYRALLLKVRPLLLRYATHTLTKMGLRDPAQSEDLAQETLLALHQKRATYDPTLLFTPWLFAVARYKLIDFGRRRKKDVRSRVDTLEEDLFRLPAPEIESPGSGHDVRELLDGLPDKQRALLELVKLRGASIAEASAQTGMSESAVKVTIHRALKTLKARIRRSDDGH